jgi:hypothetical protein
MSAKEFRGKGDQDNPLRSCTAWSSSSSSSSELYSGSSIVCLALAKATVEGQRETGSVLLSENLSSRVRTMKQTFLARWKLDRRSHIVRQVQ